MSEEIEIAKQWLGKARNDLLNADNNLKAQDVPYDTVCFHCQQAAEKLLKAYLAANATSPPMTHDLLLILEEVLSVNRNAEALRDALVMLMPYSVEIRYPDGWYMPSEQDAKDARGAAEQVLEWLESAAPQVFEGTKDV